MKAIIKSNGVAIDVVPKGNLFVSDNKVYQESVLYFPNSEEYIDWKQRRYEIAKAAMQGILSNQEQVDHASTVYGNMNTLIENDIAQYAVDCADALIEELKKK